MGRATTETPARRKAAVQTKRVRSRVLQEATVLVQKSPVLAREAAAPLASTARVHSREALAPTKAAKRPLQRTPVLVQQERLRKTLLRRVPTFFPQSCE